MIKRNYILAALTLFTLSSFSMKVFSWGGNDGGELPAADHYQHFDTSTVHYWLPEGLVGSRNVNLTLAFNNSCDYVHPFEGRVTSGFGHRRRKMHYGMDIDLETGDKVKVAFEGMVRFAMWNNSYGNLVIVRHANGLETYYAHLSKIDVKPGDYVQAGDYIGLGGNTGHSFGAHLHFEVRYQGIPINPEYLIDFEARKLKLVNVNLLVDGDKIIVTNAEKFHTIKPGDDVYSIAAFYGVSIKEILALNPYMKEDDALLVDTRVRYH